jgi:hypothetical protein
MGAPENVLIVKIMKHTPFPSVVVLICLDYIMSTADSLRLHPDITEKHRHILSSWIAEVIELLHVSDQQKLAIFCSWVALHRQYLRKYAVSRNKYQLYGMVMLYVASPAAMATVETSESPSYFAEQISDHAFTAAQFEEWVAKIPNPDEGSATELHKLLNAALCGPSIAPISVKRLAEWWHPNIPFECSIFLYALSIHEKKINTTPDQWKGNLSLLWSAHVDFKRWKGIGECTSCELGRAIVRHLTQRPKFVSVHAWRIVTDLRGW